MAVLSFLVLLSCVGQAVDTKIEPDGATFDVNRTAFFEYPDKELGSSLLIRARQLVAAYGCSGNEDVEKAIDKESSQYSKAIVL
jgi:hypothetical protein